MADSSGDEVIEIKQLSTGSPLAHESFDYIYNKIKEDVLRFNLRGTDIVFVLCLVVLSVSLSGQLQGWPWVGCGYF